MKILFVSAVLPYPLRSGGQIRIYNILKQLSRNHEITLVSFIRKDEEKKLIAELNFCKEVHVIMRGSAWQPRYITSAIFGKYPLLLATYANDAMHQLLRDILVRDEYDVVHLEPFYVWPSIPETSVPMVISEHNVEYAVYLQYVRRFAVWLLRPFLWLDVQKLMYWEHKIWKKAPMVTAVSQEDASVMQEAGVNKVEIVPNGVDVTEFVYKAKPSFSKAPNFLFVGDFRWFPNTDALHILLDEIWPVVKNAYPDANLRVVGRHMNSRIVTAVEQSGGEVGQDVADISVEYRNADILIAPHGIAGGTKFKMLEAMASGCVVITTPEGAAGLNLTAGKHYLEAKNPAEYVVQIQKLWTNTKIYKTVAAAARKHVEDHFSWDAISSRLDAVWKEAHAGH